MYWKFLRTGAVSPFTGFAWAETKGQWVNTDPVMPCRSGIHACRSGDLPYWLSDELWGIEVASPIVEGAHKVVATRARLANRVDAWTPTTARLLADACVERTAMHVAEELGQAGFDTEADRLVGQPVDALAAIARETMSVLADRGSRQAAKLCGYVVDAAEARNVYPVATIAYIAARAANRRSSPVDVDLYVVERDWQARWLAEELSLDIEQ